MLRRLGRARVQDPLSHDGPEPWPEPVPEPDTEENPQLTAPEPREQPEPPQPQAVAEPAGPVPSGFVPGDGGPPAWTVRSRYAGAMLLHAFAARAGAGDVFAAAAGQDAAAGDVALLAAVSACFALGAATTEAFKHLAAAEAGPLAGLVTLPALRTLRPRLSAIADRADPLELQRMFASAMLAADPVVSNVYYVDDHFVPYTGAKPVGKGWNNKRGRAERGRADTHVTAHDGRAVCFVTGDPSGLSVTLPKALAELNEAVPGGTRIMLGFDRGGAYPAVFTHCREQNVHWVTYRRAPLAVPAMLPVITAVTVGGKRRQITWAEEKVQVKDYGEARQLTLSEQGRVVLQVLTSDFDARPADILSWLKSRWREENFLKYASENYGIDKICDYAATIEVNTKITGNPARKAANAAIRDARNEITAAQGALAALLTDPDTTAAAKNKAIPAANRAITAAKNKLKDATAARDQIPSSCAPTRSIPTPGSRCCAPGALPADGAAAPRAQRRALARQPPQRLPARRRRIPRRHPPDHHPRPRRNHHLHPRRDHRHPRTPRRSPRRPRPHPAHRRDQHPATVHPRRHPAHHLPHHTTARDLTRPQQALPEIWGSQLREALQSPGIVSLPDAPEAIHECDKARPRRQAVLLSVPSMWTRRELFSLTDPVFGVASHR